LHSSVHKTYEFLGESVSISKDLPIDDDEVDTHCLKQVPDLISEMLIVFSVDAIDVLFMTFRLKCFIPMKGIVDSRRSSTIAISSFYKHYKTMKNIEMDVEKHSSPVCLHEMKKKNWEVKIASNVKKKESLA
jgi:hypothetical protein